MRRRGSRVSGFIVFFILFALGFTNAKGNKDLEHYYNQTVRPAYDDSIVNGWNAMVAHANSDGADTASVAAFLKEKVLPPTEKWASKLQGSQPPQFAASFHENFGNDLLALVKHVNAMQKAAEADDGDAFKTAIDHGSAVIKKTDEHMFALRKDLVEKKNFKFEQQ